MHAQAAVDVPRASLLYRMTLSKPVSLWSLQLPRDPVNVPPGPSHITFRDECVPVGPYGSSTGQLRRRMSRSEHNES